VASREGSTVCSGGGINSQQYPSTHHGALPGGSGMHATAMHALSALRLPWKVHDLFPCARTHAQACALRSLQLPYDHRRTSRSICQAAAGAVVALDSAYRCTAAQLLLYALQLPILRPPPIARLPAQPTSCQPSHRVRLNLPTDGCCAGHINHSSC
jgi:hypothetical protein